MAQSVERHIGNVEVTGPIPVSSFIQKIKNPLHLQGILLCLKMNKSTLEDMSPVKQMRKISFTVDF